MCRDIFLRSPSGCRYWSSSKARSFYTRRIDGLLTPVSKGADDKERHVLRSLLLKMAVIECVQQSMYGI